MWKRSIFSVRKLRDNFKPELAFQQWNRDESWIKKLKKSLIWMSSVPGSHWWHLFYKKWRAETLQLGLKFDNFKPLLESGIFKCISWLNGSFLGVMIPVSERGSWDPVNGIHVTAYLAKLLLLFFLPFTNFLHFLLVNLLFNISFQTKNIALTIKLTIEYLQADRENNDACRYIAKVMRSYLNNNNAYTSHVCVHWKKCQDQSYWWNACLFHCGREE